MGAESDKEESAHRESPTVLGRHLTKLASLSEICYNNVRTSAIGRREMWGEVDRAFNQLRFPNRPTPNSENIINFILSIVTRAWYDFFEFAKHSPDTCISF